MNLVPISQTPISLGVTSRIDDTLVVASDLTVDYRNKFTTGIGFQKKYPHDDA